MSDTIEVELGARSYKVRIGSDLLACAGDEIAPLLNRPRVAVVTDRRVGGLHLKTLRAGLARRGISMTALELPPGEATKDWDHLRQATEWLLDQQVERGDMVVALGGGVIGDLAGFAAAILRRGVRFVQIPTTLLAQVDSSVGGKTGINTSQGKNLVGAFHQPAHVLADLSVLDTLDARDFRAGHGEVVKYALLGDAEFFRWLEEHGAAILSGDRAARQHAVARSVAMKAGIVMRDETEQGERAMLNLGHTFGHALEAATGYGDRLLHGEGVAIGCALAFDLSAALGLCEAALPARVRAHLRTMGMKAELADIPGDLPPSEELIALMEQDKKVRDGRLRLVLVRDLGKAFLAEDVERAALRAVLDAALARRA